MTQDYKNNLLKYLTGNLSIESGNDYPDFSEDIETLNNNVYDDIKTILINEESATNVILLGKLYNSQYDNYLLYGAYTSDSDIYYGFIYLVDGNFNIIQMIKTFSSGTKLFPITALNQDNDNNIYGLSYNINQTPSTTRVLLFNNIFTSGLISGNYEAVLRNDYIVPYNYNQVPYRQNRIIKSPNGATYYIILSDNGQEKIIRFTINVGAANEWIVASLPIVFHSRFDAKLDKSSGNEELYFYGISNETPSKYYEYKINGDSVTLNKNITLMALAGSITSQVFVKDINNVYLYANFSSTGLGVIYKVNGNNLIKIYEIQALSSGTSYYIHLISMFEVNGGMFFFEKYKSSSTEYTIYLGYINTDNTYTKYEVDTYTGDTSFNTVYGYVDFYHKNLYNLVNFYIPVYADTNTTKKITIDYNSINYNGNDYSNTNLLVPNKARLYNSNNKMIFARNLYNNVINANTTISTLNIPNTNLNDVTIYNQSLIGETNYVLMNNQESITKNIYENLNINFYTTLRMINNNDPNNQIFNQVGSNRINSSVSSVKDYNNAKATKIRINYSDNTTKIVSIEFYPIKNYYYTKFSIYIDKLISSIDFVSNDEETIYNTIRPNFIVGKYYTINQSVRIDERIQTQPVLYNNEQLYYNNEEIYY